MVFSPSFPPLSCIKTSTLSFAERLLKADSKEPFWYDLKLIPFSETGNTVLAAAVLINDLLFMSFCFKKVGILIGSSWLYTMKLT